MHVTFCCYGLGGPFMECKMHGCQELSVLLTVETITLAPIIFLYCYIVHLNIFQ